MIVEWDPLRPRKKITELIRKTLDDGGIIVYPTDTLYGMGCDLFNIKAIKKLYQIKRLPTRRALSIICMDFRDVSEYAVMSDFSFGVLKQCLPGPYTFILRARKIMPKLLMTEKKEVGIRIPSHPVPAALTKLLERPIINTSARVFGEEILSDPRQIEKTFKGSVDLVIDGEIMVSEASTVMRLVDDTIEVLREGKGPFKHLLTG
ncbi:MAG: threonylcarbamoyl-AMP synthase [Syntrophorhabdus aromaticivorans]|uniref:Threonylcarbamoyl-AMP synthase n=1 Tax=Syntrophorhabdus aromaticivorans TaxID=328301 RepID=A0A971M685_9BACT|nr:threonylcarbamoyl-AMP synthase [Syntrophorhabdus aromaticivorans]